MARSLATIVGGKGSNQAIAAARAGARCAIIAAVGDDVYADAIRATLREAGVDTSALRTVPGPSGTALIVVDDDGQNSIVVIPGANAALTTLTEADYAVISAADAVLFQLEVPIETVVAAATRAHGLRVLNAAPARPLPHELLDAIDLLVVNETEATAIVPASRPGAGPRPTPPAPRRTRGDPASSGRSHRRRSTRAAREGPAARGAAWRRRSSGARRREDPRRAGRSARLAGVAARAPPLARRGSR